MPAAKDALPKGDFRDWPAIDAWADQIAHEPRRAGSSRRMTGHPARDGERRRAAAGGRARLGFEAQARCRHALRDPGGGDRLAAANGTSARSSGTGPRRW